MPGWEGDSTRKEEEGGRSDEGSSGSLIFICGHIDAHNQKSRTIHMTAALPLRTSVVEQVVAEQSVSMGRLLCQAGLSKSSCEHLLSPAQTGVQSHSVRQAEGRHC